MAIDAQRNRVLNPVVGRVGVDVVDLERHVGTTAVGTAATVGREHPRPKSDVGAPAGAMGPMLRAVRAVREHAACEAGTAHQRCTGSTAVSHRLPHPAVAATGRARRPSGATGT